MVAHTEDRATSAPTDRSMPPPMMTKVIPTVTTPMIDALTRMFSRLLRVRNAPSVVATPTIARITSTPTRPRLRTSDNRPPSRGDAVADAACSTRPCSSAGGTSTAAGASVRSVMPPLLP